MCGVALLPFFLCLKCTKFHNLLCHEDNHTGAIINQSYFRMKSNTRIIATYLNISVTYHRNLLIFCDISSCTFFLSTFSLHTTTISSLPQITTQTTNNKFTPLHFTYPLFYIFLPLFKSFFHLFLYPLNFSFTSSFGYTHLLFVLTYIFTYSFSTLFLFPFHSIFSFLFIILFLLSFQNLFIQPIVWIMFCIY